jgi:PEP-CTERM motif
MLKKLWVVTAMAAAALVGNFGTSKANLIGDTVHVEYLFPNSGTVSKDFGSFVVTGSENLINTFNDESLMFSSSQITLTNLTPGAFIASPFDGYDVQLLLGAAFVSVTEDPLSSALFATGSVLTFSSNDLKLNIAGTCTGCVGGEKIILDVVQAAAVPEPASLALLATGLLGFGLLRRRRKGM